MSDERAKKIKLMLFDVDGVMTDGTIFLFPAPAGAGEQDTREHRENMAERGGFGIASGAVTEAVCPTQPFFWLSGKRFSVALAPSIISPTLNPAPTNSPTPRMCRASGAA